MPSLSTIHQETVTILISTIASGHNVLTGTTTARITIAGHTRHSQTVVFTPAPTDVAMTLSHMPRTGEEFRSVRHILTGDSKEDSS